MIVVKNNISANISQKIGKNLYLLDNHPVKIVKDIVFEYFQKLNYKILTVLDPVVSVEDNFDFLRIPKSHPGRQMTDTYYLDDETVLRTHMTCHIKEMANNPNYDKYVICGDVYRKDTIDATHFPVFHQIDGFAVTEKEPMEELKSILSGLINLLFPNQEYRFKDDYFPFTEPSLEVEVKFGEQWLEILGGGSVHYEIMENLGMADKKALAFGIGIERLAMILFEIKDIRLFWSNDKRFISQFKNGEVTKFVPYSKYPEVKRDISMWVPDDFHENDFYDLVRDLDENDVIEDVNLFDTFVNNKRVNNKKSFGFRVTYRSPEKTLTDKEVNSLHENLLKNSVELLNVEIR